MVVTGFLHCERYRVSPDTALKMAMDRLIAGNGLLSRIFVWTGSHPLIVLPGKMAWVIAVYV